MLIDGQPDPKKMAAINDPIGAQLKAIADQQRAQQTQQAIQAAASAAAQINAKLGIQSEPGQSVSAFTQSTLARFMKTICQMLHSK